MFSVGAHPDGHQQGVSIQSLKNRGTVIFLRTSRICEKLHRPESWRGSLLMFRLSFPRFWTSSIEQFFRWLDSENQQ